jgi:hypothetical protein
MEQGDTDMRMESPREWQASRVFASVLLVMYFVLAFSVFSSLSPLPIVIDAQADQVRPMTLEEMSKQFYDIREQKGHFDGGEWNNDVDLWSGRKHILMQALSNRLDAISAGKRRVIEVMGKPDRVVSRATAEFEELPVENSDGEILIYYWRNSHDYLYFKCGLKAGCESAWQYALE